MARLEHIEFERSLLDRLAGFMLDRQSLQQLLLSACVPKVTYSLLLGTILVVNQYTYPDLAMRAKTFFTLCFILFLIFVFIGDKVLPKPLSTASLQTRTTMNNFLLGLFPTKSKTKDLTQEREKKLEQQLEQSGSKKK